MRIIILLLAVTFFSQMNAQALPIHQKLDVDQALQTFKDQSGYHFLGIVKLSNCSGSLVRFEKSKSTDKALVLTNGHCVSAPGPDGMIAANKSIVNQPSTRTFQFLADDGSIKSGSEAATMLLFATITWNDVAIYQLASTYDQIKKKFGVDALVIDSKQPSVGNKINILSGYWQRGYSCSIAAFAHELHEGPYVSLDSMRYSSTGCQTIHGTSGSPVISADTGKIVGINSTGNDAGEKCTMDNPCEVSANGDVFYQKGLSYADETFVFYSCLNAQNKIDLKQSGCKLFH